MADFQLLSVAIACLSGLFAVLSGCGYAIRSCPAQRCGYPAKSTPLLTQNSVLLGRRAKTAVLAILSADFHDGERLHTTFLPLVPTYRMYPHSMYLPGQRIFFYLLSAFVLLSDLFYPSSSKQQDETRLSIA